MKGKTKLRLTWTSVLVHCLIVIGWIVTEVQEPIMWASWFGSFNATLAIYEASKTYKDKVLIENKENKNGNS